MMTYTTKIETRKVSQETEILRQDIMVNRNIMYENMAPYNRSSITDLLWIFKTNANRIPGTKN